MKKLFGMLIGLYFIYFVVEFLFIILGGGYNLTYTIVNEKQNYTVKETFSSNQKYNDNFYEFNVNDKFYFRLYDSLKGKGMLIDDINSYSDDSIECIYPTFKVKNIHIDVLCKKDNQLIYYQNIKGTNSSLDQFVSSLPNYNATYFINNMDINKKVGLSRVYLTNFKDDYYIGLNSYKGLYNLRKDNSKQIKLFKNDVYENTINTLVKHYYVTANYDLQNNFSSFFVVDLTNSSESEINYNGDISFSSYVQGVVDNDFYLFDPVNKIQYKINPRKKSVKKVSENEKIQYFNGKEFVEKDINEAIQNHLLFKFDDYDTENVVTSLGTKSGYRYFITPTNGQVVVTRASLDNTNDLTYLFTASEVRNVRAFKDKIFFIDNEWIKMYSDSTGLRTLVQMNELKFNQNLNYYVYIG